MTTPGIDFGNDNCVICIPDQGRIEPIANEVSNRQTPSIIGFGEKSRALGEAGLTQYPNNPRNTITELKRLLGRSYYDPSLREEMRFCPFTIVEGPDGLAHVQVQFQGSQVVFPVELVLAFLFEKLKQTTENKVGAKCNDVVVSCPGYYTDLQRRKLIQALRIAGWTPRRILNEHVAVALSYGFFRSKPEEQVVAFVDLGASCFTSSIVSFFPPDKEDKVPAEKLQVRSVTWSTEASGSKFDEILLNYVGGEWKKKTGNDIFTNPRAAFKVRVACEKAKKVMSGVDRAPINLECLMNDCDLNMLLLREDFERLSQPLIARARDCLERSLAQSGKTLEQIQHVEIVGGGRAMPMLLQAIADVFGRPVSQLNRSLTAECVAQGCTIQCAQLSSTKSARPYKKLDVVTDPIATSWNAADRDDGSEGKVLFPRGQTYPVTMMLTMYRWHSAEIKAFYTESSNLSGVAQPAIGTFVVHEIPSFEGDEPRFKVPVRLNDDGVVDVGDVQMLTTVTELVPVSSAAAATTSASSSSAASSAATTTTTSATPAATTTTDGSAPAPMQTEPSAEAAAPAVETRAVQKVKRYDLRVTKQIFGELSAAEIEEMKGRLCAYATEDKLVADTADKRNECESYILEMRRRVNARSADDELTKHIVDSEVPAFLACLDATESWLYDDGYDATKARYSEKLEAMQALASTWTRALKEEKDAIERARLEAERIERERIAAEKAEKALQEKKRRDEEAAAKKAAEDAAKAAAAAAAAAAAPEQPAAAVEGESEGAAAKMEVDQQP